MGIALLIVVAVVLFLENCFRSIPKKHRLVPHWIVWLLTMPFLARHVQLPLASLGMEVVYNAIVFNGLVWSFHSYLDQNANGTSVLFGVVSSTAVCAWPLALLAGGIAAKYWLEANPVAETPGWIRFQENQGAVTCVYVVLYSLNLMAMNQLKSKVDALERQKTEKPKVRPTNRVK